MLLMLEIVMSAPTLHGRIRTTQLEAVISACPVVARDPDKVGRAGLHLVGNGGLQVTGIIITGKLVGVRGRTFRVDGENGVVAAGAGARNQEAGLLRHIAEDGVRALA